MSRLSHILIGSECVSIDSLDKTVPLCTINVCTGPRKIRDTPSRARSRGVGMLKKLGWFVLVLLAGYGGFRALADIYIIGANDRVDELLRAESATHH